MHLPRWVVLKKTGRYTWLRTKLKAFKTIKRRPAEAKGGTAHGSEIPLRIRQQLRDRGARRRASGRPQLAAKGELRPLCGTIVGLALHRAAGDQSADLALPRAAHGAAPRPLPKDRSGFHPHRAAPRQDRP